jgi:hypothetical protein
MGAILEGAKAALHSAEAFTNSATKQAGNKENPFKPAAPKSESTRTDYSHARQARQDAGHEFMGIRSNQAPELNTALESRAEAERALKQ